MAKIPGSDELVDLGRAMAGIVHDLKNQLNGLKLYATFLRNRMERDERPQDEVETIGKLMAGLDRAAHDLAVIVRYSQPVELRRQPKVSLAKVLSRAIDEPVDGGDADLLWGEFDSEALVGAFRTITAYASAGAHERPTAPSLRRSDKADPGAIVEWPLADSNREGPNSLVLEGIASVRIAVATRIVEAHGGHVDRNAGVLRVCLPLTK